MPVSRADNDMIRRFLGAAAVLHLHGLMTDLERRVCHARMLKWKARRSGMPRPVKPKRGAK